MRQIKFRAVTDVGMFIVPSPDFSLQIADTGHTVIVWSSDGPMDEIPVTSLDQFTEFPDIKGNKIYENDIVYVAGYGNLLVEFPFIDLYDAFIENDIGAILGNIYEQPELLNEKL